MALNPNYEIKQVSMSVEMQEDAIAKANEAFKLYKIDKDIATYMKKQFDDAYKGSWNCIVGKNFGVSITHETRYLIYMIREAHSHILLFRAAEF